MGVLKLWQWAHDVNIENANLINIQAIFVQEDEDKRENEKLHNFLIYEESA